MIRLYYNKFKTLLVMRCVIILCFIKEKNVVDVFVIYGSFKGVLVFCGCFSRLLRI